MSAVTQPSVISRAQTLHRDSFGGDIAGVWSAPGRVNLIGEHTDYNSGFVLPIAIGLRTAVAVAFHDNPVVRVVSEAVPGVVDLPLDGITKDAITGWSGYALGVVWAVRAGGVDVSTKPGITIAVASDVPLGAGLSSSAALECAVALALNDVWGLGLDRGELATAGRLAENEVVGANTGMMDQMASLLAIDGHALFVDCADGHTRHVPLDTGEYALVVMDTRVSHQLADSAYGARRASCEKAASTLGAQSLREVTLATLTSSGDILEEETLRRARHVVTENARVIDAIDALEEGDLNRFGHLLTRSHESMRDDFEISCDELDLAVDTALDAGALGARLTGGGFGGAAIALIHRNKLDHLGDLLDVAFTRRSWTVPRPVVVRASAGAIRERV